MRTNEQRAQRQEHYRENKESMSVWRRNYYATHKEYRNNKHKRQKELNQEKKLEVISYYSDGQPQCKSCGISDIDVLSLDHINGGGHQHRRINPHAYRWAINAGFPEGFQVLCFNCNWKRHINGLS